VVFDPVETAEEFFEAILRLQVFGAGTPETAYSPAQRSKYFDAYRLELASGSL
jgi:hypothetical protein